MAEIPDFYTWTIEEIREDESKLPGLLAEAAVIAQFHPYLGYTWSQLFLRVDELRRAGIPLSEELLQKNTRPMPASTY